MGKADGPYRYYYAWNIDPDHTNPKGYWKKTIYCFKPDPDNLGEVKEAEVDIKTSARGKILSKSYGLLPIRYNHDEAYAKAKKMSEILAKRAERKAKANRGFVRQDDDKMKITVLCRHKGEDKYGYKTYQLSPEDAAKRNKTLTLGRAKLAIQILDKMGVPHPNLDKIVA